MLFVLEISTLLQSEDAFVERQQPDIASSEYLSPAETGSALHRAKQFFDGTICSGEHDELAERRFVIQHASRRHEHRLLHSATHSAPGTTEEQHHLQFYSASSFGCPYGTFLFCLVIIFMKKYTKSLFLKYRCDFELRHGPSKLLRSHLRGFISKMFLRPPMWPVPLRLCNCLAPSNPR